jgi:hypothetical protein
MTLHSKVLELFQLHSCALVNTADDKLYGTKMVRSLMT